MALAAALLLLLSIQTVAAQTVVDYDDDDDGLIDIRTLAQLRAIQHDTDGNGDAAHADYIAAFDNRDTAPATRMGCPGGACTGYELRADLNFDTDGSGSVGTGDDYPTGFRIGSYNATLRGNGHSIANYYFRSSSHDAYASQGLIDTLNSSGHIHGLALLEVDVQHTGTGGAFNQLGALVGSNSGRITAVYVTGSVSSTNDGHVVGALVGNNNSSGFIGASYSTASVTFNRAFQTPDLGAIAGYNTGVIHAVYATGPVSTVNRANRIGALVGANRDSAGRVRASYATGRVSHSHASTNAGGAVGETANGAQTLNTYHDRQRSGQTDSGGYLARQLKRPVGYTGIYADWNVDIDGVTGGDDPWDFGGPRDYPLLKIDFNGDGEATWQEFGNQQRAAPPGPPPYNWRTDHPESYANARYEITATCQVRTTGTGDEAITTSTLTFDLAEYARPITLALSLWDKTHFRSLQSLGLAMPELRREGQTATVEVVTDPARTRFRLDGPYGLNLVLGYADCHTDDS